MFIDPNFVQILFVYLVWKFYRCSFHLTSKVFGIIYKMYRRNIKVYSCLTLWVNVMESFAVIIKQCLLFVYWMVWWDRGVLFCSNWVREKSPPPKSMTRWTQPSERNMKARCRTLCRKWGISKTDNSRKSEGKWNRFTDDRLVQLLYVNSDIDNRVLM